MPLIIAPSLTPAGNPPGAAAGGIAAVAGEDEGGGGGLGAETGVLMAICGAGGAGAL
jgi:hypothetical protein